MSINEHEKRNGKKDKDISKNHTIVMQDESIKAGKELLTKEKEFTLVHE